ncbi:hypothetical protein ECG_09371 [Echinococcus granulosus]|nr:hypothetical protein ECG_09371 [Echinococcus granulosus]
MDLDTIVNHNCVVLPWISTSSAQKSQQRQRDQSYHAHQSWLGKAIHFDVLVTKADNSRRPLSECHFSDMWGSKEVLLCEEDPPFEFCGSLNAIYSFTLTLDKVA